MSHAHPDTPSPQPERPSDLVPVQDQVGHEDWNRTTRAMAERLMQPGSPGAHGDDAHKASLLVGRRTQRYSITMSAPGMPVVTMTKEITENGVAAEAHCRGAGHIVGKVHEVWVKTLTALTNGIVRIIAGKRGAKKQKPSGGADNA